MTPLHAVGRESRGAERPLAQPAPRPIRDPLDRPLWQANLAIRIGDLLGRLGSLAVIIDDNYVMPAIDAAMEGLYKLDMKYGRGKHD